MKNSAWLILGNQLVDAKKLLKPCGRIVFLAEDYGLCTYYKFHKQKILFFLTAMRDYCDELTALGYEVQYAPLTQDSKDLSYEDKLLSFCSNYQIDELHYFEIEDKFFEDRIRKFSRDNKIKLVEHQSPLFLTSRKDFQSYLERYKKPFMKTFYEMQRKRLDVLMENGCPVGGRYSFDTENRKKLPEEIHIPAARLPKKSPHLDKVKDLVENLFEDHPGSMDEFYWPSSRSDAKAHLEDFIEKRLGNFGNYQDAIDRRSAFNFHSLCSPLINVGLLEPAEVIERVVQRKEAPLNSREAFVRQVLGWREFVRGVYQNFSEEMETTNFFNHERKLKNCWYSAETGLEVLDDCLNRVWKNAYNHHIERLMIISNVMLLCEIQPREVYRWFMEMYVDSSDWVMAPNVYGMGQFSDGGIFATKPYICSSNYIRRMSHYPEGDWSKILDSLFWRFIDKYSGFFSRQYRMGVLVKQIDRMGPRKMKEMRTRAEEFIERVSFL